MHFETPLSKVSTKEHWSFLITAICGAVFGGLILLAHFSFHGIDKVFPLGILFAIASGPFFLFCYYVLGLVWGDFLDNRILFSIYVLIHMAIWSGIFVSIRSMSRRMNVNKIGFYIFCSAILLLYGFIMLIIILPRT